MNKAQEFMSEFKALLEKYDASFQLEYMDYSMQVDGIKLYLKNQQVVTKKESDLSIWPDLESIKELDLKNLVLRCWKSEGDNVIPCTCDVVDIKCFDKND